MTVVRLLSPHGAKSATLMCRAPHPWRSVSQQRGT